MPTRRAAGLGHSEDWRVVGAIPTLLHKFLPLLQKNRKILSLTKIVLRTEKASKFIELLKASHPDELLEKTHKGPYWVQISTALYKHAVARLMERSNIDFMPYKLTDE